MWSRRQHFKNFPLQQRLRYNSTCAVSWAESRSQCKLSRVLCMHLVHGIAPRRSKVLLVNVFIAYNFCVSFFVAIITYVRAGVAVLTRHTHFGRLIFPSRRLIFPSRSLPGISRAVHWRNRSSAVPIPTAHVSRPLLPAESMPFQTLLHQRTPRY